MVPGRIYHRSVATLVFGAEVVDSTVARHDTSLLLGLEPSTRFDIDSAGARSRNIEAAVIAPGEPHALTRASGRMVRLAIQLTHPRFRTLRSVAKERMLLLDRRRFNHLNDQLDAASQGRLSSAEARKLVDAMLDALLEGVPPAPPMDKRVTYALRKLGQDIDYPFDKLADELDLSRSRLSHLFAEQIGISMRGCQAWGRMGMAWRLVVWNRELSLTQIAHQTKFSDSSHLARAFKAAYGTSPNAFRRDDVIQTIGEPTWARWTTP